MLHTPGKIIKEVILYPVYLHSLNDLLQSEKELYKVVRCSLKVRVWEGMGKVIAVLVAGPGLSLDRAAAGRGLSCCAGRCSPC